MRKQQIRPVRTTVNLADASQVRAIKKRFRVSDEQLTKIVSRIGNSIAAIGKEVALQRAADLSQSNPPAQTAPVVLITANGRQKQRPSGLPQARKSSDRGVI
jgi:hypothetical protein